MFRISSLPDELFRPLFAMDDEALRQLGARRSIADHRPGFPCRVSLEDAMPGETVILTPFAHLAVESPYRASGPVYVREGAARAWPAPGEVPALLRSRSLSVRAYDPASLMLHADLVDGLDLELAIARFLDDPRVGFLHVHFAKPGCYACRVDRA